MSEATDSTKRRRLWLLPAAVVLIWILGSGVMGPFAGKLTTVQENDNTSFLPASAESTKVSELQSRLVTDELIPTIVVWETQSGVTQEIALAVDERLVRVRAIKGVAPGPSPVIPSQDGNALQAIVQLEASVGEELPTVVSEMREIVPVDGTDAYVTGPGGIFGDFGAAFGSLDTLLLLAAITVVLIILLVVYRSPILPFLVIFSALLALSAASALVYFLASNDIITLNGQSQAILFILVVGAATDYALLLVARFREELTQMESKYDAVRIALRQSFAPILASGTTVILGVLCLLLSDLNSNQGLGPVSALGIAAALVVMLTFLPAALVLLGRWAFWPFRPKVEKGADHTGIYGKVARVVGRSPRRIWIVTAIALAAMAAFAPTFKTEGVAQTDVFLTEVESVNGQEALGRHFPAGSGSPAVIFAKSEQIDEVASVVRQTPGVASVEVVTRGGGRPDAEPTNTEPITIDGLSQLSVVLEAQADKAPAARTVGQLRESVSGVSGAEAIVGGPTAVQLDIQNTSERDSRVILPAIILVIFIVLAILLRSLLAPLFLIGTVVLSFAATIGVAALVFNQVLDFPGGDPGLLVISFVFLVALGVDYNIFLMTRAREEAAKVGTRRGVLAALAVTGAVITSAGLVLAATFGTLGVVPLLFLVQTAFIVAFGVLLDALVVRTLLVPAFVADVGGRIWWPSKLASVEMDEKATSAGATPAPLTNTISR